ncbi:hypothetical protein KF707_22430 [Candidatus Obscuribacterales bacterium]|nr:hypothetical protein [Candidatus Obscuribacterales bacterium]MBX3139001.1 hypothetical protein [Candidatus Obscuribacterales bacterium]MBX3153493.1 hypothetical protein [Candidatus Obscuribacterales bacterium]
MLPQELEKIEKKIGCSFPNLRDAAERSKKKSDELAAAISTEFKGLGDKGVDVAGIGLLITGSIARGEITEGSDCDFLLVSHATPSHESVIQGLDAVERVLADLNLVEPGGQGVFGDFTTAAELFIRIGLERDSNPNMTRRLSILLESAPFLDASVRDVVLEKVIERYCARYHPSYRKDVDEPVAVPRFLVNDLIRYWRTIAVDFEAKRWRKPRSGWGLRYAKLLSTRKIMFAGGLASYLTTGEYLNRSGKKSVKERYDALVEYLRAESDKSPAARLASLFEYLGSSGQNSLAECLKRYDEILGLLNSQKTKDALKSEDSSEMQGIIKLASELNSLLEEIFFEDTFMRPLTRGYSLF